MTVMHAVHVGDGILAIAPLPGSDGTYGEDLEHIHGWAPAIVISLTTEVEMIGGGVRDLGARLQDQGTRWVHLPIEDFDTPGAAFLQAWPKVSAQVLAALAGGGRVLIHCRGGCGRSGMVALRLMIEAGEAPDEALARLRHVRPCAVETDAQMAWAMAATRGRAIFVRHAE
ncbi:protein-tyrosine phosphatase family protein [Puniceibacterium sediminis]|uniref:Dual specificity phosphatase, catalytic domain n=1 Tax=Puniceibacterium sediminis TaxID=1608407 RepID=A0A238USR7_9RHOB|nr:dual specificity protein phosphatase family protein [Puniceibacterium sediminis]SNR25066.1 Dual specificity phosphatase, catalytic domain [Puniceibacterium sediminis]